MGEFFAWLDTLTPTQGLVLAIVAFVFGVMIIRWLRR